MTTSSVSRAVRRAARLSLAFSAPALVACGGALTTTGDSTSESSTTDSTSTSPSSSGWSSSTTVTTSSLSSTSSVPGCSPVPLSDAGFSCFAQYELSGAGCFAPDGGLATGCLALCVQAGGPNYGGCSLIPAEDGGAALLECNSCVIGRRPRGLRRGDPEPASGSLGHVLAAMAHLEAASVLSFERLASELRAHGAPARLSARSMQAASDEVRHARMMGHLAARAGVKKVRPARVRRQAPRGLEAIALENAVEGCVRETFGAAQAHVQAARAQDPKVRAAMSRIATDETRHSELSWAVARWIEPRLDAAARRRIDAARARAVAELEASLRQTPDPMHAAALGLPEPAQSAMIHAELRRALWSAAVAA